MHDGALTVRKTSAAAGERLQKPLATCVKKLLTDVPTKLAQPTTMIEMNAAIRQYSIDVAPD